MTDWKEIAVIDGKRPAELRDDDVWEWDVGLGWSKNYKPIECYFWNNITHIRIDMAKREPEQWAYNRADQLTGREGGGYRVALARMIQKYEQPPVDPLEEEVQQIKRATGGKCWEDPGAVEALRIALRRGIEIGKGEAQ